MRINQTNDHLIFFGETLFQMVQEELSKHYEMWKLIKLKLVPNLEYLIKVPNKHCCMDEKQFQWLNNY